MEDWQSYLKESETLKNLRKSVQSADALKQLKLIGIYGMSLVH